MLFDLSTPKTYKTGSLTIGTIGQLINVPGLVHTSSYIFLEFLIYIYIL